MSDQLNGQPRDFWSMAPPASEAEALQLVRSSEIAGYVFAALCLWGAVLSVAAAEADQTASVSFLIAASVAAGFSYVFGKKRSVWIPAIMLLWLIFEAIDKVITGNMGFLIVVAALFLAACFVNGIQGARHLRTVRDHRLG